MKASWTFYKQCGGKKPAAKLRFSKSGDENIERGYATHYVSPQLAGKQTTPDIQPSGENRDED